MKSLPFKDLPAREPTAKIMGFIGYRHTVLPLLQTLSHKSRAFIFKANGLPGFVEQFNPINSLRLARANGEIDWILKWQFIRLTDLEQQLNKCPTREMKRSVVALNSPLLYIYLLKVLKRFEELAHFREQCYNMRNGNIGQYTQYIHGWWFPWLED